jgi:hypothetical protein
MAGLRGGGAHLDEMAAEYSGGDNGHGGRRGSGQRWKMTRGVHQSVRQGAGPA